LRYRRFAKARMKGSVHSPNKLSVLRVLILAVLVVGSVGPACQAADEPPSWSGPLTLSQLVVGIVTRSADLNYITEQDSEVFAFYRNTPVDELNTDVFLELLRRPAETDIVRQPWSSFFQLRTQSDSTGRWRELQQYLEANLTNLSVFRLPRDRPYASQYDLYAVGVFNGKTVVGVQMFGVAT
jgi:Nuclease A inhibitor-like protein